MSASFGRITRQDALPGLLINTGKVYGLAIEAIEKKGYHILTISPGLTQSELILTLFTRQRPNDTAISFLEQENIQFLILDTP